MTQPSTTSRRYRPPNPLSGLQTFLWLIAGIAGMFLLVSAIFAVKLGVNGRLPFGQSQPLVPTSVGAAQAAQAAEPPREAQAAPAASTFVSGAENIIPSEAAHLATHSSALDEQVEPGTAPVPPVSAASAPTPPVRADDAATAPTQPPASPPMPPAAPVASAASAPATPPAAKADASAEVQRLLDSWAAAWRSKNVDAYLAHYADSFVPGNGLDHAAWAAQRRQRLARPGPIELRLDNVSIHSTGDSATARFVQHYRAGSLKLSETKTLALARSGGSWLIVGERIGD